MKAPNSWLQWVYLILAITGGILPAMANVDFMNQYGPAFDISLFVKLSNVNPAAQSLSRDLIIGAGAVTIWMIIESRRLHMRHLWLVLLSTFTIAFAFAAPLFLFLRERRMQEMERIG
ncbi:MAG: DUF2834 domain-containing protein [Prochlorococcus sp.]|tara:strand:+ start:289 stop:642 length:354 start_codon:yes stop_codon:yes gene_type:complete